MKEAYWEERLETEMQYCCPGEMARLLKSHTYTAEQLFSCANENLGTSINNESLDRQAARTLDIVIKEIKRVKHTKRGLKGYLFALLEMGINDELPTVVKVVLGHGAEVTSDLTNAAGVTGRNDDVSPAVVQILIMLLRAGGNFGDLDRVDREAWLGDDFKNARSWTTGTIIKRIRANLLAQELEKS